VTDRAACFAVLFLLAACTPPDEPPDEEPTPPVAEEPAWGEGDRSLSGNAFFFGMETVGQIDWLQDVEDARLFVYEAPELEVILDPTDSHAFVIEGIPTGVEVTLALTHPDFFPHLTSTFVVNEDLVNLTFQSVSNRIAELAGDLLQIDTFALGRCQMATTVTAPEPQNIWAPGEPGATVTLSPPVPEEQGPYYFNESVMPTTTLTETTSDGGVTVMDAAPGEYIWSGHKDGVEFGDLKMKCVAGWLTNAAPPWGMNVLEAAPEG
jgi:hypothetical protein